MRLNEVIKNIDFLKNKSNLPNASQVGIVVKDIERTKKFYRDYFNFKKFMDLEFPFTEVCYCGK